MLTGSRNISTLSELAGALSKVSTLWLDPTQRLRVETVKALQVSTGLSRRQIEMALTNCFEELTEPKITAYIRNWGQSLEVNFNASPGTVPGSGLKCVLHVLPANAFTAWVHGAVITLLAGHRCHLLPSSREPVFARMWWDSLRRIDSVLAERVEIANREADTFLRSDCVVVYGSDETIQKIASILPKDKPLIGYGHKLSVGVVYKEAWAEPEKLLENVISDCDPFRLQGCLSPQILYIEGESISRWPELEAVLDVAPKIKPFTSWSSVESELAKFSPYLSCVGYAGNAQNELFLRENLTTYNGLRICPLGEMQRPTLFWVNGGIDLINLIN